MKVIAVAVIKPSKVLTAIIKRFWTIRRQY